MPSVVTREDLLALVRKSNLVPPGKLDAFLEGRQLPEAAPAVAAALCKGGLLTRFQADQLLAGRCRGFFVGKYRVLQPVGSGAMGVVYLCEHVELGNRVAIKLLSSKVLKEDVTALARFRREARAAATLTHPNIIRTFDFENINGNHFLVMEYVEGINLYELVRREGALPVERAVHYILQAALGLQHIHEARMVHRDLKPSNLLLDREGTIKIHDLGLALFRDERHDNLTQKHNNGTILGTVDFLAPEQAANSSDVDIRADIYSLGATLYFLLAGDTPFGEMPLTRKLLALHTGDPKPIRDVRRDVELGLARVLGQLMARDPADRYQTPLEVAYALAPFLSVPVDLPPREAPTPTAGGSSSGAASDGIKTRPDSHPPLRSLSSHPSGLVRAPQIAASPVSRQGWIRRHPRIASGLAVALALVCMTVGAVVLSTALKAGPALSTEAAWKGGAFQEPTQPKPPTPPPPRGKQVFRVAAGGGAGKLRTVREALTQAKPGDVIEILDPVLQEELLIQGPTGQDVTLRTATKEGVTWKPTAGQAAGRPLLRLVNVPGFRLEGNFALDGDDRLEQLVQVEGTCPGLSLRGLRLQRSTVQAVLLRGARGEPSRPIVLEGLHLQTADRNPLPAGVAFRRHPETPAVATQNVIVRDSRFEGRLSGAVCVAGEVDGVSVLCNRFYSSEDAVKVDKSESPFKVRASFENNTFADGGHGLTYAEALVKDAGNSLLFRQNLFVRMKSVATLTGPPPPVVPDGVKAKWVWAEEGRDVLKDGAPTGDRYFRKTFYLATTTFKQARLDVAADDSFTVWVNGQQVGEGKAAERRVRAFDVLPHLKAGKNLLAVRAHNDAAEAGVIAQLTCQSQDGVTFVLAPSDDTWRWGEREMSGWLAAETDDTAWKDVRVLAEAGQFRSDLAWDSAPTEQRNSRLLLPASRNNYRDAASPEDQALTLGCRVLPEVALPTDAKDDRTFLRYPEGDPLARLAPGNGPVGAPPLGVQLRPANGDVVYRLDLAQAMPFSVKYRHRELLSGSNSRNWPTGWTAQVWRAEAVGEIRLENVQGVPAVAIRNLEGQFGSEFHTTRTSAPVEVRAGQRYVVRVEYLLQGKEKGRLDLRFGDFAKPGSAKADLEPTGGDWRTGEVNFEAPGTQIMGIYLSNFGVGRDKTLFVRAVEVAELDPPATSNKPAQTVYRLKLDGQAPAAVRVQGQSVLEETGALPPPWTGTTWKTESVSRFSVEPVDGALAFGVRNLQGTASSMLFLNDLPLKAGPTYVLRFKYRLGKAAGQIKIKEDQKTARLLEQLDGTSGQWRAVEYRIKLDRDGLTRFEFFNLADRPDEPLFVKDVEVLDLGR